MTRERLLLPVSLFAVAAAGAVLASGIVASTDQLLHRFFSLAAICMNDINGAAGYLLDYHNFWSFLTVTVFGTAFLYSGGFFLKQMIDIHRLSVTMKRKTIVERQQYGIRYRVVDDQRSYALTFGFLRPLIVVSTGMLKCLTPGEQAAVLSHERFHQLKRHPLVLLSWGVLSRLLFFLPVSKDLIASVQLECEVGADRFAARHHGRRFLGRALFKMYGMTHVVPQTVTAFALSDDRIDSFINGKKRTYLPLKSFVISCGIAVAAVYSIAVVPVFSQTSAAPEVISCPTPTQSMVSLMSFGTLRYESHFSPANMSTVEE